MKNKILFITFLFSFSVYSQENKIVYIFPDSVEVAVNEYITQQRENTIASYYLGLSKDTTGADILIPVPQEKISYYLRLSKDTANIYRLLVLSYDPSEPTHRASLSNRVAIINDKRLPLSFGFDEFFGTPDTIKIGKYGERNGYVSRTVTNYGGGYVIEFIVDYYKGSNYGKILKKESFFRRSYD